MGLQSAGILILDIFAYQNQQVQPSHLSDFIKSPPQNDYHL